MSDEVTPPATEEYHKAFTGCLTDTAGSKRWFINGAYGREGGLPAVEYLDGGQHWYIENPKRGRGFGQRDAIEHRLDGPAVIRANGDKLWFRMGDLHRDEGLPAIELADGTKKWFEDGKFIRRETPLASQPESAIAV